MAAAGGGGGGSKRWVWRAVAEPWAEVAGGGGDGGEGARFGGRGGRSRWEMEEQVPAGEVAEGGGTLWR